MNTLETVAGRWDHAHTSVQQAFGQDRSYILAADWLNVCVEVEDRGCGLAYAKKFITTGYMGVDGSPSPWTDKVVDLMSYRRRVPGILLRHVLEHNFKWPALLANALEDFTHRMVVVLHITPASVDQHLLAAEAPGPQGKPVPNIRLCKHDLLVPMIPFLAKMETIETGEIVYYLEKAQAF